MNNIKNYTIFSILLMIIAVILISMNIIVLNEILLKSISVTNNIEIVKQLPEKYGYSDMLSLIMENSNLELLNIDDTKTQEGIINVDIKFNCEKEKLNSILTYLTTKDNFKNLNFITITSENKSENKEKFLFEGIINADFIKVDKN
jgi:hypothetical protein